MLAGSLLYIVRCICGRIKRNWDPGCSLRPRAMLLVGVHGWEQAWGLKRPLVQVRVASNPSKRKLHVQLQMLRASGGWQYRHTEGRKGAQFRYTGWTGESLRAPAHVWGNKWRSLRLRTERRKQ